MTGKALTILTVLGLVCAPLAAQTSEDPVRDDLSLQEQQQVAPDEPAVESDLQSDAPADVSTEAELQNDDGRLNDADEELPKTASPLALLALLGGAGVATGAGLRLRRRR